MAAADAETGESGVQYEAHGYYSSWDQDDIVYMHECTLFVTDEKLIIGDMGEYEEGIPELLPDPVEGIARSILKDDDPDTITLETANKRSDTEEIELTDITEIETERDLPGGSQLVEIEEEWGEVSIYVGSAASYGGAEETQEFVSALESAAKAAGGAPRVTSELDL